MVKRAVWEGAKNDHLGPFGPEKGQKAPFVPFWGHFGGSLLGHFIWSFTVKHVLRRGSFWGQKGVKSGHLDLFWGLFGVFLGVYSGLAWFRLLYAGVLSWSEKGVVLGV